MPEFVRESTNCLPECNQADILLGGANAAQRDAIQHHKGAMLVLAGPGSGKTFVIIRRIQYLIQFAGVMPANILVITFTKAAALQMQERFQNSTKDSPGAVTFGTFHSIFFSIVKKHTNYNNKDIISISAQRDYIKHVLLNSDYTLKPDNDTIDVILNYISVRKNLGKEEACRRADGILADDLMREELFHSYEYMMHENHKIDYDDMLVMCLRLLEKEQYRSYWQSIFQFILVDEFQDINPLQYRILRILAEPQKNLFVVGDDDQAIYGFRGSDPKLMKQLLVDYPECRKVVLGVNYRCGRCIVEIAGRCIRYNKDRFEKSISSGTKTDGVVRIYEATDLQKECEYLRAEIKKYSEKGETIAILFRTNARARKITELLFGEQSDACGDKLYQLSYICDILAVLRFVTNGHHREEFLQFMNKPMRYISRDYIDDPVDFDRLKRRLVSRKTLYEEIERLERDCRRIEEMDPYQAINYVRYAMKYERYLQEESNKNERKLAKILQNIDEIQNRARNYQSVHAFLQAIDAKKELKRDQQGIQGVQIYTYHGAKGLEFDHVFMPALNFGEVPRGKILSEEEMEEERRMFYVAMTRAKKSLTLSYQVRETEKEVRLSPFIQEIKNKSKINYPSLSSSNSTISSNSTVSRYSSNASATASYSSSSSMYPSSGSSFGSSGFS